MAYRELTPKEKLGILLKQNNIDPRNVSIYTTSQGALFATVHRPGTSNGLDTIIDTILVTD